MPIVYCLVGRGVVVECDVSHPLHSGNFKLVALKLLNKVNQQYETSAANSTTTTTTTPTTSKQTLLFDGHTFNFLSLGPIHCLALCTADVKQHTAFLFLADVMEMYRRCGGELSTSGGSGGSRLQGGELKAVTDFMHTKMEQYNSNTTSSSSSTTADTDGQQRKKDETRRDKQQHKDKKDRAGKQASKSASSNKRAAASSASSSTADAVAGLRDDLSGDTGAVEENPDAVHNVKRELEVS